MRLPALFPALALMLLLGLLLAGCTATDDGDDGADDADDGGGDDGGDEPMTTPPPTTSASSPTPGTGNTREVEVADNEFRDGTMTIAAGTSVEYTNVGQNSHTVTIHYAGNNGQGGDPATTYKLDETLQAGDDTSYTFSAAGTYHVFCRFHGSMTSGMASVVTVT